MKPISDWPDDMDAERDPRADNFVWAIVFIGIGLLILFNRTPESPGWFFMAGSFSIGVGVSRLFRAVFG